MSIIVKYRTSALKMALLSRTLMVADFMAAASQKLKEPCMESGASSEEPSKATSCEGLRLVIRLQS